jgi:hypothetical protein
MPFSSLVSMLDATCQEVFSEASVTIHPQSGAPDVTTPAIIKNPRYEEDYNPLGPPPTNPVVLLLFVQLAGLAISPLHGDTATFAGEDYDVFDVDADLEGGGTLKLRKRSAGQRWDQ